MATKKGVYQLDNGFWAYRFSILIDGKQISRKKTTDEFGNKLPTQAAAAKARAAAITAAHIEMQQKYKIVRRTYQEVYDEYSAVGRKDRAYTTIQKQELLWNSRIKENFGKRYVDDVSVGASTTIPAMKLFISFGVSGVLAEATFFMISAAFMASLLLFMFMMMFVILLIVLFLSFDLCFVFLSLDDLSILKFNFLSVVILVLVCNYKKKKMLYRSSLLAIGAVLKMIFR